MNSHAGSLIVLWEDIIPFLSVPWEHTAYYCLIQHKSYKSSACLHNSKCPIASYVPNPLLGIIPKIGIWEEIFMKVGWFQLFWKFALKCQWLIRKTVACTKVLVSHLLKCDRDALYSQIHPHKNRRKKCFNKTIDIISSGPLNTSITRKFIQVSTKAVIDSF